MAVRNYRKSGSSFRKTSLVTPNSCQVNGRQAGDRNFGAIWRKAMTAKLHRNAGTKGSGNMAEERDREPEWIWQGLS